MNLTKQITINGKPFKLTSEDVRLNLFTPGRALFNVVSTETLSGIAVFSLGYKADALTQYFVGYIEKSTAVNADQQRVFCRELTAALNRRLPLALRACTLRDVLQEITDDSGVPFVTPQAAYTTTRAPAFYSVGNGYHAMDSLADVYGIERFIWQQQGDGKVFVGSWADSFWAGRTVEIPVEMQKEFGASNRSVLPVLPKLRPGAIMNGSYLTGVKLEGNQMQLTWHKDPFAARDWAKK